MSETAASNPAPAGCPGNCGGMRHVYDACISAAGSLVITVYAFRTNDSQERADVVLTVTNPAPRHIAEILNHAFEAGEEYVKNPRR